MLRHPIVVAYIVSFPHDRDIYWPIQSPLNQRFHSISAEIHQTAETRRNILERRTSKSITIPNPSSIFSRSYFVVITRACYIGFSFLKGILLPRFFQNEIFFYIIRKDWRVRDHALFFFFHPYLFVLHYNCPVVVGKTWRNAIRWVCT